ncbi:MAG TPA: hypothetical protein VND68_12980, partial [Chloroflexia bacterium]|nr:hypothetical protein [Chloroflexia bacterium]
MPTKTERILGYLPSTFLPAPPRSTALYAVADAFGNELLLAENSLAALMLAHWIDHADKGAEFIRDLACIAALYGLAPRGAELKGRPQGERASCDDLPADEMVEEFREHLRRYIRTFIEGTVTVQGVLRVTAEALGLRINGEYTGMDTWWKRRSDEVVTFEPGGSDAARKLFGTGEATATGRAVRPAEIVGVVDLSGPVDLRGASVFRFKLDDHQPVDLDLATQTTHI